MASNNIAKLYYCKTYNICLKLFFFTLTCPLSIEIDESLQHNLGRIYSLKYDFSLTLVNVRNNIDDYIWQYI